MGAAGGAGAAAAPAGGGAVDPPAVAAANAPAGSAAAANAPAAEAAASAPAAAASPSSDVAPGADDEEAAEAESGASAAPEAESGASPAAPLDESELSAGAQAPLGLAAGPVAGSPAAGSDGAAVQGAAPPPSAPALPQETPLGGSVLASGQSSATLYSRLGSLTLYDLPGAADPWAGLPRGAGAPMTSAYVAGYGIRPGQASAGPGSAGGQGVFRIEGFEVGDAASPSAPLGMSALTAQEVQVTTGGADLSALSPGLQINLVERRGTNEWRASLRGFGSGGPLAAGAPRAHGLPAAQAASENVSGDRVRDAGALGAELGGPLRQDALWFWGGLDHGRSALDAFGGQPFDSSDLGAAAKLDARLPGANSATLAWNLASRRQDGQGAGPDRAPETTIERRAHDQVWRLADTAILSSDLYATATAGLVQVGDREVPRGGFVPLILDPAGVSHGSWYAEDEQRNTRAASGHLSASGQLGGAASDLRLAGEWRRTEEASHWAAPAWAQATAGQVLELPPGQDALDLWRDGDTRDAISRLGLWLGDTLSWSRATATFGLRYDRQTPRNLPSATPAVPGDPLLRAVDFAGNDADGVRWSSLVPRLALAWEPPGAHRLLLRASLARYAAQLSSAIAARVDPAAPASAAWHVPAGVTSLDFANLQDGVSFWYSNGFDPRLPPGAPANVLDPRLRPELTDELILGAEQPLGADGSLGLRLLYRRITGILDDRLLVRDGASDAVRVANAGDWVQAGVVAGTLPNGAPYASPYYDLRPALTPTGGTLLVNGDRQQRLLGLALDWRQRLARRWTARGHLTWQDWRWQLGPVYRRYADPTYSLLDGDYNGQPVAGQSPLPGGRPIYLSGRWSFDLGGVVQLPGAFSAAAQINGRQGVPLAYFQTVARDRAGPVDVRAAELVDAFRSDDVVTLDARIDKQIDLGSEVTLGMSLEALNLLAAGQVLRRESNLGVTRANFVDEVVTPRILRLGLKLQFR